MAAAAVAAPARVALWPRRRGRRRRRYLGASAVTRLSCGILSAYVCKLMLRYDVCRVDELSVTRGERCPITTEFEFEFFI